MNLFDKFTDTIFLKESNNLEKQLKELKSIPVTKENKDELAKNIKLLEYGIEGEKNIAFELKNANIGMYVLHDIIIEYEDLKAQIDYIIITKGYTYLVECKNLYGNITIDNNGQFKREYSLNGKIIKEAIYSPLTQSDRHLAIFKKWWMANQNKLRTILYNDIFESKWYKSIVVLSNSKSLLNNRYAPKEVKNRVLRCDQLVNYIENDLSCYDKNYMSNQKNMLKQANCFLAINIEKHSSTVAKYQNKNNTQEENGNTNDRNDNLLKQRLIDFRKDKSRQMNIPAYYIFNNDELIELVNKRPKEINELKSMNLLPPIKIKCHGEEIIKIINSK